MTITVHIGLADGQDLECKARDGQKLLDIAQANNVDLEGACEGSLACATCHVIVDRQWYDKLPYPSQDELDMLDLAPGRTPTSRLSCQIKMHEKLNGLSVKLP